MNRLSCDAVGARRLLRFVYEGDERIVEPHLHGINTSSPRPGYTPADARFRQVFCSLEA